MCVPQDVVPPLCLSARGDFTVRGKPWACNLLRAKRNEDGCSSCEAEAVSQSAQSAGAHVRSEDDRGGRSISARGRGDAAVHESECGVVNPKKLARLPVQRDIAREVVRSDDGKGSEFVHSLGQDRWRDTWGPRLIGYRRPDAEKKVSPPYWQDQGKL